MVLVRGLTRIANPMHVIQGFFFLFPLAHSTMSHELQRCSSGVDKSYTHPFSIKGRGLKEGKMGSIRRGNSIGRKTGGLCEI